MVPKFIIEINDEFIKQNNENVGQKIEYTYEVKVENRGAVQNNIMMSKITIKTYLDKEKQFGVSECEVITAFITPDLETYLDKEKNILNLPEPLEYAITSISISHARAIMHNKFAGTFLQNALLPIVNPKEFLKKKENLQQ